jgi:4-amino-4-deoxy-L-arabinose transferase-like glycosyltransferase
MIFSKKIWGVIAVIFTLILCYFPLCHRIDTYCVQSWDESRNYANAIEMLQNHHWLTRYYENQPDMWELKPPFLVWLQAFSFSIFGFNELAARFPSMFFSISTILLLIWLGHKITGSIWSGIIASMILVSSMGYVGEHVARFGDHDVILAFFSLGFLGFFYMFSTTKSNSYLIWMFVFLFFGWFTKSIIIFMFLPALFLWILVNNQFLDTIKNKTFWIGFVAVISLILGYYFLREQQSPGYMQQVWMNEMFGRYFDKSPNYHYQKNDFWYYWNGFTENRFSPFIFVLCLATGFVIFFKKLPFRNFLAFLLGCFLIFFLVISAGTKNFWYDAPLYPIAALCLGTFCLSLFQMAKPKIAKIALLAAILFIIYPGYSSTVKFALERDKNESHPLQSLCYFLKDNNHPKPKKLSILHEGHYTALYLYIEEARVNHKLIRLAKPDDLNTNDTILVTESYYKQSLDTILNSRIIYKDQGCELREFKGLK